MAAASTIFTDLSSLSDELQFDSVYDEVLAESLIPGIRDIRKHDIEIRNSKGELVFEAKDLEFPASWSDQAAKITASKYFASTLKDGKRVLVDRSVRDMIRRVAVPITLAARGGRDFLKSLVRILVEQRASFNSPVWFNVGVNEKPQCSACFILQVDDTMESILDWITTEGLIFRGGSGSGVNLSRIRSRHEKLSNGGSPSGPLSFAMTADVNAGTIKSGGKTRRAAKMLILDADHPDIEDFIWCKYKEEKKIPYLVEAGYSLDFGDADNAYAQVFFQNANNSVRVRDSFMNAVEKDLEWELKARTTGETIKTVKARDLFRQIAEAAWHCGDPGLQFHDIINVMNTARWTAEIEGSNPCSEYMFLNNTACNLASMNLLRYYSPATDRFDINAFVSDVAIMTRAMDAIVSLSSYPTEKIARESKKYRTLGLGYTNLGGLLMSAGVPYDSDVARNFAGAVTSLMTAVVYETSSRIAEEVFSDLSDPEVAENYEAVHRNKYSFIDVLQNHVLQNHLFNHQIRHDYVDLSERLTTSEILSEASEIWKNVNNRANDGLLPRNFQATVIAPTGTISFMMDAATTGIEPELALVKYKMLAGGGVLKMVNPLVRQALETLGYPEDTIEQILQRVEADGHIENAVQDGLKPEHLPVFDCSFVAPGGTRFIRPEAHVLMMAAVQPFISGAISKTVNLPSSATVEDVERIYMLAWKQKLKAIAIYRDGCKQIQPLSTSLKKDSKPEEKAETAPVKVLPKQRKMPKNRQAMIHEFTLAGFKGFLTVGLYEDGSPGEIFVDISREGSTISGLLDTIAILTSFALQYGVPLEKLVEKFKKTSFEPSGWTDNEEIPHATSLVDYIFRYMEKQFIEGRQMILPLPEEKPAPLSERKNHAYDGPPCRECGNTTVPNGSCYVCTTCGATTGCS